MVNSGLGETWRDAPAPYFFGAGPQRLYACHHLPAQGLTPGRAVLICNATGHEYERSHRTLRQLGLQLAKDGHHALRFDYRGTGDSAGECAPAGFSEWRQDINSAIDECARISGQAQIGVVGLRLGASLAAQSAAARKNVHSLVLYAPIVDGKSLLREWEDAQAEHDRKHGGGIRKGVSPNEILGFGLSGSYRAEIEALTLPEPHPALRRALILAEQPREKGIQRLAQSLERHGAQVSVEPLEPPAIWKREPFDAIVPFKLVRHIVNWIKKDE